MEPDFLVRAALTVATGFYLSYIPVKLAEALPAAYRLRRWTGAGFIGTLLGWGGIYLLPENPLFFSLFLAAAISLACWASGVAERAFDCHDDSRIIIDEVVGYWAAVAFLPRRFWLLAAGFVLFRVLDSVKLPPYRRLERLPGGFGVVGDDVGAGIVANLLLRLVLRSWAPA